jgi:WD40 repeat protein
MGRVDGSLDTWAMPSDRGDRHAPRSPRSPHTVGIAALLRDASARVVVSVDVSGRVVRWDAERLRRLSTTELPTGGAQVVDAEFAGRDTVLMVATTAAVQLWDAVRGGQTPAVTLSSGTDVISHAAISPDATRVAATARAADGSVVLVVWDTRTGTSIRSRLEFPETGVDLAFSGDGSYVGLLSALGWSSAFRASDGARVAFFSPESSGTTTLTGGVIGAMVAVGATGFVSANGSTRALAWAASPPQVIREYQLVLTGSPSALAATRSGLLAADVAGSASFVPYVDPAAEDLAAEVGRLSAGSRLARSAAPDLVLGVNGNRFQVWDLRARRVVGTFTAARADGGTLFSAALDRTGRRVAIGYLDGGIEVRDVRTGRVTGRAERRVNGAAVVAFAGDDVVGTSDASAAPADAVTVAPDGSVDALVRMPHDRRIAAVETHDATVAVGLDDGTLVVTHTHRPRAERRLPLGTIAAWQLAFSLSGDMLVAGDGGGRIHRVDLGSAEPVPRGDPITTDHGPVLALGFTDRGRIVAAGPGVLLAYAETDRGTLLARNVIARPWAGLTAVHNGFLTVDSRGQLHRWRLDTPFVLRRICAAVRGTDLPRDWPDYSPEGGARPACRASP